MKYAFVMLEGSLHILIRLPHVLNIFSVLSKSFELLKSLGLKSNFVSPLFIMYPKVFSVSFGPSITFSGSSILILRLFSEFLIIHEIGKIDSISLGWNVNCQH